MDTLLRKEGFHQYLIFKTDYKDMDRFEINMLACYEGQGLLPLELQCKSGGIDVSYEISGSASLLQVFQGKEMDGKVLRELFDSLWKCCEELEEYLLPMEGLILQPELIYYQPGKKQIRFCYLPGNQEEFSQVLLTLVEFCMQRLRHQDSDTVLFIYKLYRMLLEGNGEEELKECLSEFLSGSIKKEEKIESMLLQRKAIMSDQPHDFGFQYSEKKEVEEIKMEEKSGSSMKSISQKKKLISQIPWYIYGALVALSMVLLGIFLIRFLILTHSEGDLKICIILAILMFLFLFSMKQTKQVEAIKCASSNESVALVCEVTEEELEYQKKYEQSIEGEKETSTSRFQNLRLESEADPGETRILESTVNPVEAMWELESLQTFTSNIPLVHLPGILGRKKDDVDYPLLGEGVSRRHLLIFQSGEDIYAEDLASTNGTYLNGERLTAGVPMQICEGDRLSIGPLQYQVKKTEET